MLRGRRAAIYQHTDQVLQPNATAVSFATQRTKMILEAGFRIWIPQDPELDVIIHGDATAEFEYKEQTYTLRCPKHLKSIEVPANIVEIAMSQSSEGSQMDEKELDLALARLVHQEACDLLLAQNDISRQSSGEISLCGINVVNMDE